MSRDFQINGETMVSVIGGAHAIMSGAASGSPIAYVSQLGLADRYVTISPNYYYDDVLIDDFGPNVPAEKLWMLSTVNIGMSLIHYDPVVLSMVMGESMGGADYSQLGTNGVGTMVGAGSPLGNYLPLLASGNHWLMLGLASPVLNAPWRFLATHLTGPPLEIPLGTGKTIVKLNFEAIPYPISCCMFSGGISGLTLKSGSELTSSGTVLWDDQDIHLFGPGYPLSPWSVYCGNCDGEETIETNNPPVYPPVTTTGSTTFGSPVIVVSTTGGVVVGMSVSPPGLFQPGTTVAAVGPGQTITVSTNALVTETTQITFQ